MGLFVFSLSRSNFSRSRSDLSRCCSLSAPPTEFLLSGASLSLLADSLLILSDEDDDDVVVVVGGNGEIEAVEVTEVFELEFVVDAVELFKGGASNVG